MEYKVSVIIPIYNMGKYLRECLDSIISQELKDIEILAINDGSTDDSLKILLEYQKLYPHIKIYNQINQGAGLAKNNGLRNARGKYVTFIDPDDYYPNKYSLSNLYKVAEEQNVLICGGIIVENHSGIRTKRFQIEKRDISTPYLIIETKDYDEIYGYTRYLFRTDFLREKKIFFPAYRRYEEEAFTVNALAEAKKFCVINEEVYEHRIGYKRQDYPLEICIDILCGIRDVYKIVKKYNLWKMYENRLRDISRDYIWPFYRYSFCGYKTIDKILEEINEIIIKWGKDSKNIITEKKVNEFRKKCIEQYEYVKRVLRENKAVLIYGAGINTKVFLGLFENELSNVIGIAVTQIVEFDNKDINGFKVRPIIEYLKLSNYAKVLVLAAPRYWEEIDRTLIELVFKNVYFIDVRMLELANTLCKK